MQEQQPVAFGNGSGLSHLCAAVVAGMNDMGARRIGDHQGTVGRAASLTITSRTTPHTLSVIRLSKQRGSGRAELVVGNDDGKIIERIMTKMLLRTTLLRSQGERLTRRATGSNDLRERRAPQCRAAKRHEARGRRVGENGRNY